MDEENIMINYPQELDEEKKLENFRKAGKITAKIRKRLPNLVNPGETALDIVETIEKMIFEEGGVPGFPVNISIGEIAAHYTPNFDEEKIIGEKDLIKIDFGVSVNGCIVDNAITIDLSEKNEKLLQASKEALDAAVTNIKEGIGDGDIGKIIEKKINDYGFKPIENLTGHMIAPYNLHAGIDIPNIKKENSYYFKEGDIIAIEPFATDGAGRVVETPKVEIYSIISNGKLRMRSSRELLGKLLKRYLSLPFAKRWIMDLLKSRIMLNASLKELLEEGCLHPYPVLKEANNGVVAQFEHTLLVQKDGVEILDGPFE